MYTSAKSPRTSTFTVTWASTTNRRSRSTRRRSKSTVPRGTTAATAVASARRLRLHNLLRITCSTLSTIPQLKPKAHHFTTCQSTNRSCTDHTRTLLTIRNIRYPSREKAIRGPMSISRKWLWNKRLLTRTTLERTTLDLPTARRLMERSSICPRCICRRRRTRRPFLYSRSLYIKAPLINLMCTLKTLFCRLIKISRTQHLIRLRNKELHPLPLLRLRYRSILSQ